MTEPGFFSPQWAVAVRDALAAGPSDQDRSGKLSMYWDFFDHAKASCASSWALGCRDLPATSAAGPAYLHVQWTDGAVSDCRIARPGERHEATYQLGMDYADWRALNGGYDAQRTVMYRKILLEEGNVLEFFKTIYFFIECLAIIGRVPADFAALSAR
jgi:hypothetical protein